MQVRIQLTVNEKFKQKITYWFWETYSVYEGLATP